MRGVSLGFQKVCEAKYFEVFVNDKVLVFDVAVSYSMTVQVLHGICNLGKNITSLVFGETFMLRLLNAFK